LSDLLARASLDCPTLYRLGMTIAYIDGDKAALPWFQGAVASAERETKPAAATLEALSQLGGRLFNAPDFATSIRCYTILAARAVPGTPDARRFQFMLADSYVENGYNEGRPGIFKGLEIVLGWMKSEDFEQLSEVDQAQLHWLAANMYFRAGRYAESLPYFEEALKQEKVASWPSWTRKLYCVALARAGRIEDAKAQQAIWMDLKHPTELDTGFVKQVIRQAELNNAARQAASPNHERKE
jgi:tetratricopeptide (TPR) repeat protein